MAHSLISNIFGNPWLIAAHLAEQYLPQVHALLNGKALNDNSALSGRKNDQPIAANTNDDDEFETFSYYLHGISPTGKTLKVDSYSQLPANSTALIPIKGALMLEDQYCGPMGTGTIAKMVESADRSSKVSAIVFEIDSPGGMVKGTQELANIIQSATTKTIASYTDAYSAAYWLLSACDEAYATSSTAGCGSIGTMIELVDVRKFYANNGIELHTIRATDSKDKNQAYYEALDGKYELIRVNMLDPINDLFKNAVRQNRSLPKDTDTLTGKTYLAAEAIEKGLSDGIKPINQILSGLMPANSTNTEMSFFEKVFGSNAQEAERVFATEQELEQAQADLSAANDRIAELEAENTALSAKLKKRDKEIARLSALPADSPTLIGTNGGDKMVDKKEDAPWQNITNSIIAGAEKN